MRASHAHLPPVTVTDEDMRRAFRSCHLINTTFEQTMANPATAITIRRIAECYLRQQQRISELQQADRKRAQANDLFDQ